MPNKRLKLTGGDRFKGIGVLCPWRGVDFAPHLCASGLVARGLRGGGKAILVVSEAVGWVGGNGKGAREPGCLTRVGSGGALFALKNTRSSALAGTDCRPTPLRRRASRPQLKRDPLGGCPGGGDEVQRMAAGRDS